MRIYEISDKIEICSKDCHLGRKDPEKCMEQALHPPNLAESWELTVRKDAVNTIENGTYSGKTLDEYITENPDSAAFEKFPLLIKIIDAEDRLSVHVHPDDGFTADVENDVGKTEMWYIADAKEGAEIIYGIKDGVGQRRCDSGIGEQVKTVKVKKGDSFFIPSGMLHAIGKGCLIA